MVPRGPIFGSCVAEPIDPLLVGQRDVLIADLSPFLSLTSAPQPRPIQVLADASLSEIENLHGELKDLGCKKAVLTAQSAVEGRSGSEL
jgi:hypothetical protein